MNNQIKGRITISQINFLIKAKKNIFLSKKKGVTPTKAIKKNKIISIVIEDIDDKVIR